MTVKEAIIVLDLYVLSIEEKEKKFSKKDYEVLLKRNDNQGKNQSDTAGFKGHEIEI